MVLLVSWGAAACGGDDAPSLEARGEALYGGAESRALGAASNQSTCETCHSVDGTTQYLSGSTLKDIAYRTSFKGGGAPTLLQATNACVTGWMGGPALGEGDEAYLALEAFMKSKSSSAVTTPLPLEPEVLEDLAAYERRYADGVASRGAAPYDSACAGCHDQALVLGTRTSPARSDLGALTAGEIARQVRTAGPPPSGTADDRDLTPGPMPFFEPDELSVQELADIAAFLTQI